MINKDYRKLFDTSHLSVDLKKRSLRSGAVTMSTQGAKFVLQLASTMVLARILTPNDYGIMAMVVAITGFANLFINLGLSTAVIQRGEINHAQVSTLFWLNTGIGVLATVIVAALSPAIAWFYETPELMWVALALSVNFVINGLGVQHHALLNRQMRFVALAVIQVGALLAGIVVAIVAAVYGLGYWALVLNSLTISVVTVVGGWVASGWWPGLPQREAEVGNMIRFGGDIVGFNVINYFARNLDNVLIGRFHGSGPLGFYSKAYQLLMMPITNLRDPLNKVALPALSRLQNDPEQYRSYFMKFVSVLAFVSMPLIIFMYVFSNQIIILILGSQWLGASEIFKILALVALIQPLASTRGLVLLSTGRSRKYLILGCIGAVLCCTSFLIGISWGAYGVAVAYAVGTYLWTGPLMYYAFHGTPISLKDFLSSIYKPFISSIGMGIVIFIISDYMFLLNKIIFIFVSFILSAFIYFLIIILLPGGSKDLKNYYEFGKIAFGRK